jgi:hypothetical protein
MDMQHRVGNVAWTRTGSMDTGMQHGHGQAAWTPTASMDTDRQHGHGQAAWRITCYLSMFMSMLHVRVHATCTSRPYMLRVRVHASCPCLYMPISMLYVMSVMHVHVHAGCPCPCCMSISMLYFHVYAACPFPCCMSMSMSVLHVIVHAVYPRTFLLASELFSLSINNSLGRCESQCWRRHSKTVDVCHNLSVFLDISNFQPVLRTDIILFGFRFGLGGNLDPVRAFFHQADWFTSSPLVVLEVLIRSRRI